MSVLRKWKLCHGSKSADEWLSNYCCWIIWPIKPWLQGRAEKRKESQKWKVIFFYCNTTSTKSGQGFFSWMFLLSLCNITRRLACFRIKVIFPSYNDSWLPQLPLSNSDITSKQIYITYWDHINKQGCWNLKAQYSSRIAVLFLTQNCETGVTTDTRVYRKSTQYIMWQQETGMPIWKLRMTRLEIPSQSLGLLLVFTVKSCSGEGRH